MEGLLNGLVIFVAIIYFIIINRMFDIYYFGCRGVGSVFLLCCFLAILTIALLGASLPYVVGFLVICAIIAIFNKGNDETDEEGSDGPEQQNTNEGDV